jgi:tetratricopeptide (TPR) repeat protein
MARKLSRLARHGSLILFTIACTSAGVSVRAEGERRDATRPAIPPNPFAVTPSKSEPTPVQREQPRRRPTTYHNPFANMSTAPPIEMPMRPGPVSRWRRPVMPVAESSPVKSAILSAEPQKPARPAWDQLPPLEELIATSDALRATPSGAARPNEQGTSIRFAPEPLTQPMWVAPPASPIRPLLPVDEVADHEPLSNDPFDTTNAATDAPIGTAIDPAIASPQSSGAVAAPLAASTLRVTTGDVDLSPLIISDYADSAEGWFSEAQQLAQDAASIKDLSAIIDLCQRALADGPPAELAGPLRRLAGWAHNRCGELHIDEGRQDEAVRNFQIAISLDPSCSLAIHNRAVTLAQQNDLEAALRDFNRVIELNPGLAVAYRNRAELLASLARFDEALRDYTRAIDGQPNDADLYRARGVALQRLGKFDHASADFDRALQLAPNDADAHTQRGNLAAERGDFNQALSDLRRAVALDPKWAEAYRSLAWLHATCPDPRFRDPEQAIAAAEQAAKLSAPDDCFILDALAVAHASAGNFVEADRIAEQAIATAPPEYADMLRQRRTGYQQGQPFINPPAGEIHAASHESESSAVE